jgi:hypothetical protein
MDLEKAEARNGSAEKDQQQFNRLTELYSATAALLRNGFEDIAGRADLLRAVVMCRRRELGTML